MISSIPQMESFAELSHFHVQNAKLRCLITVITYIAKKAWVALRLEGISVLLAWNSAKKNAAFGKN